MIDIEQIAALFAIHKEAHAHGDSFANIKRAAWEHLKKINEEHAIPPPQGTPAAPTEEVQPMETVASEPEAGPEPTEETPPEGEIKRRTADESTQETAHGE